MIGVDLYSGAGGMSLGAANAGIRVLLAVDIDPHSARTYKYNHKETKFLEKDVKYITFEDIKDIQRKEPLVLFGGPPCQGFSISNRRNRNSSNEKNWQFKEFFRVARLFKPYPEWIVFENVRGFLDTEHGFFLKEIEKELDLMGYKHGHFILNAADFGIPQVRNRFFMVATTTGCEIKEPKPKKNRVTVSDAIMDLPKLSNMQIKESILKYSINKKSASKYAKTLRNGTPFVANNIITSHSKTVIERFKHIPPGGNWTSIPEKLMANYKDRSRCHTGIYRRLEADKPSVVIGNYRKNMLVHPFENRGLSIREAARIQSFPDKYKFFGGIGFQQQQVGNAVPPLLAKSVFEAIKGS